MKQAGVVQQCDIFDHVLKSVACFSGKFSNSLWLVKKFGVKRYSHMNPIYKVNLQP